MFRLYDKTRRRICIVGFLALGVLPTFVVGGWCLSRRLPGCVEAEARRLGRQLGLDIRLGGFERLRPGAVLYKQLEAADPETGHAIFRCRLLEIVCRQQSDPRGQRRAVLVATVAQPEVETAELGRIWRCLQRALDGSAGALEADVQLSATELTLRAVHHPQTLTRVTGVVEKLPGGTHAQVQFRLAGVDTPEPARIRVVRNRQASPPASGFELYTGGGELPCNVLAIGLDELKPLGARCRFRGYIWANETPDGWEGEITGQLVELNLGRLVTDHFPHKLTGIGEMTIQSSRFHRGRLEAGSAIVTAGPGMINRSLLNAAVNRLGLAAGAEPWPAGEAVPYEQLAFSATLDSEGLRIYGRCTAAEPGVIVSNGRTCLLGEAIRQPTPAVALVQTLVPQNSVQVPASRQTDWLLRHLPVPEVMPLPGAEAAPPHAHLRLRDTWQR